MTVYVATIINGVVLIVMSGWAYLASQTSVTALIPAGFGMVLLGLAPCLRALNGRRRAYTYLAILITAVLIVALLRPLMTTVQAGKMLGAVRTGIMLLTSLGGLVTYGQALRSPRR